MLQLPMIPKKSAMYSWEGVMCRLHSRRGRTQVGDIELFPQTPKANCRPSHAAVTHGPLRNQRCTAGEKRTSRLPVTRRSSRREVSVVRYRVAWSRSWGVQKVLYGRSSEDIEVVLVCPEKS